MWYKHSTKIIYDWNHQTIKNYNQSRIRPSMNCSTGVRPRTNVRIKLERKRSSSETRHWFDSSSSLIRNWFGSDSSLVRLYFNGSGGCTLFDGRTISDRNRKQDLSTTLLEAQDNWFLTRTAWLCQTVSNSKIGWSPDGIAY